MPDSQIAPSDVRKDSPKTKEQLPPEILQLLNGALSCLRTTFPEKPPHTVQRLCELVLYPRKHYRTLPAWLRALDRVVSVSSGADVFPLSDTPPQLNNGLRGMNGTEIGGILFVNSSNEPRNGYDKDALGSDESLGGALLTPIPWLRDVDTSTSTDDSENTLDARNKVEDWQDRGVDDDDFIGDTIIETTTTIADAQAIAAVAEEHANNKDLGPARHGGAVTQGELIRMEQEAGVVPVPHEDIGRTEADDFEIGMDDEGDSMPHARGPDVVGTVDMGLISGEARQVRISSPPGDENENVSGTINPNDAQQVLKGGTRKGNSIGVKENDKDKSTSDSDEFVHVAEENDPADSGTRKEADAAMSDDSDIVLVDADGMQEVDSNKAGKSGVNVGADAVDSSTQ